MTIQPAVKRETELIAGSTAAGTLLMFLAFWIFNRWYPAFVPFDYRVILAGLLGAAVAVGNFFFMGITVQKVTNASTDTGAYNAMKVSYRYRTMAQLFWVVLALMVPVFNGAAGIIPLFIPNISIKLRGIMNFGRKRSGRA